MIVTLTNPHLKDKLKLALKEGYSFLIEPIESGFDPWLIQFLKKNYC